MKSGKYFELDMLYLVYLWEKRSDVFFLTDYALVYKWVQYQIKC